MIKDFIIEVPLVNQRKETKDKKWAHRTCAICSLKMVMAWKNKKLEKIPVMELVNQGLKIDGYLKDVGWKHRGIIDLAKKHGVRMVFFKNFFKSKAQKKKGLGFINKKLASGKPVLVSVLYRVPRPAKARSGNHSEHRVDSHIVVVCGLRKNANRITGYFIQDPDPKFRGSNYFLSTKEFLTYWRGGLIYLI